MKPRWWKAAVVLASVVILVGTGYISWRHFGLHHFPERSCSPYCHLRISPAIPIRRGPGLCAVFFPISSSR